MPVGVNTQDISAKTESKSPLPPGPRAGGVKEEGPVSPQCTEINSFV